MVKKNDHQKVADLINKIPEIKKLQEFIKKDKFKEKCADIDVLVIPFLRWLIASNRAHLKRLPEKHRLKEMNTPWQYILLTSAPEKEVSFQEFKKKYSSIYAFHGSALKNWHAIIRNGLLNMSGTSGQINGAAYGNGVYLAEESQTSFGYMQYTTGWKNSMIGSGNLGCLAMCEICKHPDLSGQPNPYWVVNNDKLISTRFFFYLSKFWICNSLWK